MVGDRLAVPGQHDLGGQLARLAQRVHVHHQRARAAAARLAGAPAERPRDQRVGGDVLDQVVAADQLRPLLVPEQRVRRRVAGAVLDLEARGPRTRASRRRAAGGRRARCRPSRGRSGRRRAARSPRRAGCRGAASAPRPARRRARRGRRTPPARGRAGRARRPRACERSARMPTSPRWSRCWWVMTIRSRSSIRRPCSASAFSSASSALPEFGPGVDQRQRVVLDQVAVDPAHGERRGDREAVDHDRIRSSTSSRRRSMSCSETRLSRFSRSSGSVLDGRTLKCQSS